VLPRKVGHFFLNFCVILPLKKPVSAFNSYGEIKTSSLLKTFNPFVEKKLKDLFTPIQNFISFID
jgi:hypothetical protein